MTNERIVQRVAVLIFDGVEVLDFAGPYEVFAAARLGAELGLAWGDAPRAFDVFTVAGTAGVIEATGGLRVEPTHTFASAPLAEIVIVPGGRGVRRIIDDPDETVLAWLRSAADRGALIASVCTGAWVLARAGLLSGRRATTHYLCRDRLQEIDPSIELVANQRYVDEGTGPVTAAGVSAGIDMALHLVERVLGEGGRTVAERTARYIEYERS